MYIAISDNQKNELENLINLLHIWQKDTGNTLQYKTFANATDLLVNAEKEHFTLYLLDIIMPGMSGMEAAQ